MKKNNYKIKILILFVSLLLSSAKADVAFDMSLGSIFGIDEKGAHLDFNANLWYKFDQMVFVGVGGGVQKFGDDQYYPALASLLVRLPIGGQILPVATGNWGYTFGPEGFFQWRAGGGVDIKAGNKSSIMIFGGFQSETPIASPGIYARAGVLFEF